MTNNVQNVGGHNLTLPGTITRVLKMSIFSTTQQPTMFEFKEFRKTTMLLLLPFWLLPVQAFLPTPFSATTSIHTATKLLLSHRLEAVASPRLALPTCPSVTNVPKLAIRAGVIGLSSQLLLGYLFSLSKDRILREKPNLAAYYVVALALMLTVSWVGVVGWWLQPHGLTASDRLLKNVGEARWLASIILGMFLAWDIPGSILLKEKRNPVMLVHHITMAVIAYLGATCIPMSYLFYYFGVAELSSIPLVIYDVLAQSYRACDDDDDDNKRRDMIKRLRDGFQVLAALLFTLVRVFSFTKVTILNFVPDVLAVLPTAGSTKALVLKFLLLSSLLFTALQIYWFSLIVRLAIGKKSSPELWSQ